MIKLFEHFVVFLVTWVEYHYRTWKEHRKRKEKWKRIDEDYASQIYLAFLRVFKKFPYRSHPLYIAYHALERHGVNPHAPEYKARRQTFYVEESLEVFSPACYNCLADSEKAVYWIDLKEKVEDVARFVNFYLPGGLNPIVHKKIVSEIQMDTKQEPLPENKLEIVEEAYKDFLNSILTEAQELIESET